jgi:hypothetical protein
MSIGSIAANFHRLTVETTDTFQQLRREAAEAKLYYLRDVHSPDEFDTLVDEELHQEATIPTESKIRMKEVVRIIKRKISILLKRRLF